MSETKASALWREIKPFAIRDISAMFNNAKSDNGVDTGYYIILYDKSAEKLKYYSVTGLGMEVALAAASSGDVVWLPACAISGGPWTVPTGVLLMGMGTNSQLQGEVHAPSSGTAYLAGLRISAIGSGLIAAVRVSTGGDLEVYDCILSGISSDSDGYGGFANNGTLRVFGGRSSGSTARFWSQIEPGAGSNVLLAASSLINTKGKNLWNGTNNDNPPSGWNGIGYDETGWGGCGTWSSSDPEMPGVRFAAPAGKSYRQMYRSTVTIDLTGVDDATFTWDADDRTNGVYINGTLVDQWLAFRDGDDHPPRPVYSVLSLLVDGTNVIAFDQYDGVASSGAPVAWKLKASGVGSIGSVEVYGVEGTPATEIETVLLGDRSAFDAVRFPTYHTNDTDADTIAIHHTLGTGANQAASGDHPHTAADVAVEADAFSGNLSPADTTVQAALETLDAMTGGGSGGHTIQEEGTDLTARSNLNFVGNLVNAEDDAANDATIVHIGLGETLVDGFYAKAMPEAINGVGYTTLGASYTWWEQTINVLADVLELRSVFWDLKAGTWTLTIDTVSYGQKVLGADTTAAEWVIDPPLQLAAGHHALRMTRSAAAQIWYSSRDYSNDYWNIGTGATNSGAASNNAPLKLKYVPFTGMSGILVSKGLTSSTVSVSNPPTDAELDAAYGTPAEVGAGFMRMLDNNGAGTDVYLIGSTGVKWFRVAMTEVT